MSAGNNGYSILAEYYDQLMSEVDYEGWADFCQSAFARLGCQPKLVLDLGCGTGKLTSAMASRGYEMIGIDSSPEMLSHAQRLAESKGQNILFTEQDMRSFDLFGTVDAVICSLDCINYLTNRADVLSCFDRVRTFLNNGGVFLFDVNTPWKFRNLFGNHDYIQEDEGVYLGWENDYCENSGLCRFYLSFFIERDNSLWERVTEEQKERSYTDRQLKKWLETSSLTVQEIVSDFRFTQAGEADERHFFLCRCQKS